MIISAIHAVVAGILAALAAVAALVAVIADHAAQVAALHLADLLVPLADQVAVHQHADLAALQRNANQLVQHLDVHLDAQHAANKV